jgi:predicted RNA-binding Zn-ribbon protein involved in translation (DUF1610 family)
LVELAEAFEATYFCPICGTEVTRSDFDKAEGEYTCPFCGSEQTPAEGRRRSGWDSPRG